MVEKAASRLIAFDGGLNFGHPDPVPARVLAELADAVGDAAQVDGQPAQLRQAGGGHEAGSAQVVSGTFTGMTLRAKPCRAAGNRVTIAW